MTRQTVTCLECGAVFKELVRHLRHHSLDAHSYRVKYGIPRTQARPYSRAQARFQVLALLAEDPEAGISEGSLTSLQKLFQASA